MWQITVFCVVALIVSVVLYTVGGPRYKSFGIPGMVVSTAGILVSIFLMVPAGKEPGLSTLASDLYHLNPTRASNYTAIAGKRRRRHR
jgi:hypothetical protein